MLVRTLLVMKQNATAAISMPLLTKIKILIPIIGIPALDVGATVLLTKYIGAFNTYTLYAIPFIAGLLLQWYRWKKHIRALWYKHLPDKPVKKAKIERKLKADKKFIKEQKAIMLFFM